MVIERTPEINKEDLFEAIISPPNIQIEEIVEKINNSLLGYCKIQKVPCRIYTYATVDLCQSLQTKKYGESMGEIRREFEFDKCDAENVS